MFLMKSNYLFSEEGISPNSVHRFKDEEVLHRAKKSEMKKKFAEIKVNINSNLSSDNGTSV